MGEAIAELGISDQNIITLLHTLKNITFFTLDKDFFKPQLLHPNYCLVWLDIDHVNLAAVIKKFLKHPTFKNKTKRMGKIIRLTAVGLSHFMLFCGG